MSAAATIYGMVPDLTDEEKKHLFAAYLTMALDDDFCKISTRKLAQERGFGTRASANTAWYELKKKLVRIASFIKPGETPDIVINPTTGVIEIISATSSPAVDAPKSTVAGKKVTAIEEIPAKSVAPQPIPGPSKQKVNNKQEQISEDEEETSPLPKLRRSTRLSTKQDTTTAVMAIKQPAKIGLVNKTSEKSETTTAKKVTKKTAKGRNNKSSSVSISSVDEEIPGQRISEVKAQKNMKKALADFLAAEAKKGEVYDLKSEYLFDLSML